MLEFEVVFKVDWFMEFLVFIVFFLFFVFSLKVVLLMGFFNVFMLKFSN